MLVVSRLRDEVVIVGDPANPIGRVRVVDIRGDKVRIGFDFPRHIPVHREEIAKEIVDESETTQRKHSQ